MVEDWIGCRIPAPILRRCRVLVVRLSFPSCCDNDPLVLCTHRPRRWATLSPIVVYSACKSFVQGNLQNDSVPYHPSRSVGVYEMFIARRRSLCPRRSHCNMPSSVAFFSLLAKDLHARAPPAVICSLPTKYPRPGYWWWLWTLRLGRKTYNQVIPNGSLSEWKHELLIQDICK